VAAYGGRGWSPRLAPSREELGSIWAAGGAGSEWAPLRLVLLHRPGAELDGIDDANAAQMLEIPAADGAAREHDVLAALYRAAGVDVVYVDPPALPPPNMMFVADVLFMTPAGAIVGRPASTVRAGEERWVARRLADLGIPILRTVAGTGVFEGADALWLDAQTVLLGCGLRTNLEGVAQVVSTLAEHGVGTIVVDIGERAMHLMGVIRIVDRDLAYVRAGLTPVVAIDALRERGYEVRAFPDEEEMERGSAHNFVTLGPRRIVLPAGNPVTEAEYRAAGIECITTEVTELRKAAGAIGCLTGILHRSDV
jgi:N-dimethylarginine dimethylaminohydrolase